MSTSLNMIAQRRRDHGIAAAVTNLATRAALRLLRIMAPSGEFASTTVAPTGRTRQGRVRESSVTMREAWRQSRYGLGIVLLMTAFINILKLTLPLYIFQLLDRVLASRSVETLLLLTAMTAFAAVVAALAEVIRRMMLSHWGGWIEQHFGRKLFVGSLDRSRARRPSKAIEDLGALSEFVSAGGVATWLDALWAPAFLLVVYLIHPTLGLVVLAGMLAMLAFGVIAELLQRPVRSQMRKARRRSEAWLSTADRQLEMVAGLNIGDRLADRWQASIARRTMDRQRSRLLAVSAGEGMRLAETVQRIACYGLGVWLAIEGSLTAGGVIAAAVLGRIGTSAVRRAMANWRQLTLAKRSFERTGRRLDAAKREAAPVRDPEAQKSLRLEQLTFTHDAWSRPLFRELTLDLPAGQMLCVLGASGTGKTTLAKLITGGAQPTMGTARLGGLDVTRLSAAERRKLFGYMPQSMGLVDGTIAENIASLGAFDDKSVVDAAKLAGIHDVVVSLPTGYETKLSSAGGPLSGGELRRLALARALFKRPPLVVLDEPETNLDPALVEHLADSLESLKQSGSAIVVTSQFTDLAYIADKIVVLARDGTATIYASREEFLASTSSHAAFQAGGGGVPANGGTS